MTDQEIFDKVTEHLIRQRRQSRNRSSGECAYRGEGGDRCAAGVLICDDVYSLYIENKSVFKYDGTIAMPGFALLGSGIETKQLKLVRELQVTHDDTSDHQVEYWKGLFRRIAKDFSLTCWFDEQPS